MQTEDGVPEPPERLGPYRLDQMLGSGGMGAVWRAWDERLERWVALKQIRTDATLRHGRERLRREARAAARLNHPAIVHVYDILESADGDWIVMELVEGKTLRCLLDEETALPPARAIQLCREITEGLAEAHANGILHRDLKAANVIVAPSGRAKILDFGLAKEIPRASGPEGQDLTLSTPGLILGTCFAMSPEQALGHALDERSDLFSLGSLLYEMLTGEAPFRCESPALSLARVVHCWQYRMYRRAGAPGPQKGGGDPEPGAGRPDRGERGEPPTAPEDVRHPASAGRPYERPRHDGRRVRARAPSGAREQGERPVATPGQP
jgi:serine/threonine protein kinase